MSFLTASPFMKSFVNVDSDVWLINFQFLGFFFLGFPTLLIHTKKLFSVFFFPNPVLYVSSEFATETNLVFQKTQANCTIYME